jgi:hypothetical protein
MGMLMNQETWMRILIFWMRDQMLEAQCISQLNYILLGGATSVKEGHPGANSDFGSDHILNTLQEIIDSPLDKNEEQQNPCWIKECTPCYAPSPSVLVCALQFVVDTFGDAIDA